MSDSRYSLPYIYVFLGAALWGIIGFFIEQLSRAGFTAFQIVTLRVVSASVMLVLFVAIKNTELLKIDLQDSMSFIGTGIFSVVFFNWAYFTAIEEVSLSVAVILLYTGPAFVVILSRIFFKEPMTSRKIGALILTLLGCVLVVKVFPIGVEHISWYGMLVGLGSGFGYALYSIFGKHALKKYHPLTVITYTFIFASVVMLPFSGITISTSDLQSAHVWLNILGLGFFPTALAYYLYTMGLSMVESGRASIAATVEPLVATLLGVFVFNDVLTAFQVVGMLLVLAAFVLIQFKNTDTIK
ncbi:EamA family transporter [Aliifodinibius salipaludis]|uniref:EamA family transporter n=1 Tax=Fodinibius salipaludis TaxID=2032627 RepID=A0A2A2G9P4_9BACT|nr:EamA family transporter [Aliifodinibius salipaludis]PAU93890.1 EamA family transporter [Aliifodinibius salipaludis]